ncbi:MAG: thioredoxin domain-containing protein [Planctomycetota bacterium]
MTSQSSSSEGSAGARRANRLAGETSPYLLQHAHNPVDWQPWGEAALAQAREQDRPIFLSIGYSACHWCHVMERESFENEQVAALMNEHFVCIKVDREERPDLDDVYMKATQALSGHGGWPMSVWLTPDKRPFYAGTYFPPQPRWGQPGFTQVLSSLAQAWQRNRAQILEQAERVTKHVAQMALSGDHLPAPPPDARAPELAVVDVAVQALLAAHDREHGGFGSAPKFPHADDIRLLLWQHAALARGGQARDGAGSGAGPGTGAEGGDPAALQAAVHTLDCMQRGGIHDQLGGGFSRYSTDEQWWIPHFEKMLYDNALLIPAYLEAYRLTGRADFAEVARGCCEWVLREMTGPDGGLYSTQDADSEGEEGRFFAWQRDEVLAVVGREHARLVDTAWNLGASPNFEGHAFVLVRPRPDVDLARELGLVGKGQSEAEARAALQRALTPLRQALFLARERRVHPATDDKILVAWNGLMISALAQAGAVLDEPRFVAAAQRAARFCLGPIMRPDGRRLLATCRGGQAHLNGTLADYAYLAAGLLDLHAADGDSLWLREALALAQVADAHFADEQRAGWYFTSDDHETLITRPRDLFDGALPSSNGVLVEVLVRLAELTGDPALRSRAERAFAALAPLFGASPSAFARVLLALMRSDAGATAVLTGGEGAALLARVLARRRDLALGVAWSPAVGVAPDLAALFPLLAGKAAREGRAAVYLCRRGTCSAPVSTEESLESLVG